METGRGWPHRRQTQLLLFSSRDQVSLTGIVTCVAATTRATGIGAEAGPGAEMRTGAATPAA